MLSSEPQQLFNSAISEHLPRQRHYSVSAVLVSRFLSTLFSYETITMSESPSVPKTLLARRDNSAHPKPELSIDIPSRPSSPERMDIADLLAALIGQKRVTVKLLAGRIVELRSKPRSAPEEAVLDMWTRAQEKELNGIARLEKLAELVPDLTAPDMTTRQRAEREMGVGLRTLFNQFAEEEANVEMIVISTYGEPLTPSTSSSQHEAQLGARSWTPRSPRYPPPASFQHEPQHGAGSWTPRSPRYPLPMMSTSADEDVSDDQQPGCGLCQSLLAGLLWASGLFAFVGMVAMP